MAPLILSIHVGRASPLRGKEETQSAIDKRPVEGPVALGRLGFEGDVQVNRRNHGGPHKAVCAYCACYYPQWHARYSSTMPPGSFGENLHLDGLGDGEVCLGDLYRAGSAVLRVTGPRGPCTKLSAHWGLKDLHLAALHERRTGFYMKVVETGSVAAGDELSLLERPTPQWSLVDFWQRVDGGAPTIDEIEELLGHPALDPDWAPKLLSLQRRAQAAPLPANPPKDAPPPK